jgi:hypothetical protein
MERLLGEGMKLFGDGKIGDGSGCANKKFIEI